MSTKEEAYNKIEELVVRFEEQFESYKQSDYNETLTRRDFIDPFFKALGWDVDNSEGCAEPYREVIHEDKVRVGKSTKAPDYSFRLSGNKKLFFVEAKKPSVVIKDDTSVAFQVRRYGWSAKLAISVITDFEEFAVYNCNIKPVSTDKAGIARIKYINFRDYLKEFDYLWNTFSKEQVKRGSFDKYIQSDNLKKGTATVDKEFLASLDLWRTYLATSISLKNKALDEEEINFAVQIIIDRLIFLRIAEDRKVEQPEQIKLAVNQKGDAYQNLLYIFKKADEKYNSGLFDFKKDTISEKLLIDNKVIKTIVNEMYYPCPYAFSEIPVEILGSAYEQFLGKTITIDTHHRAKIELKPEVRKAGGVYYTPQYIVDYIVKNTVGKLIDGKTPKQISEYKICDPACGSGSFLIGAYQFLLDFHKTYYTQTGAKVGKKESPITPQGQLTVAEKKRILLNNIYGVDIDVNAVEVTKLSLLLKCMEGETETSIELQQKLWHDRILPTLDNNIKCGNSLVDTDYYDGELDLGYKKKVKPFNWQKAFPEVFKIKPPTETEVFMIQFKKVNQAYDDGIELTKKYFDIAEEPSVGKYADNSGFDVVIGNPPYVRQELIGIQKRYFENKYRVYHGMADLYSFFIERSFQLLNNGGLYGVIVANKFMRANYGEPLREYLTKQTLEQIVDFGDLPVFESATTYPCIVIARKSKKQSNMVEVSRVKSLDFENLSDQVESIKRLINQKSLHIEGWNLAGDTQNRLLEKIKNTGVPLGKHVNKKIFYGIKTGLNEAFVIDETTKNQLVAEDSRSAEIIKPFLAGRDIKRYQQAESKKFLIFARRGINIKNYPAILNYLNHFKNQLTPKPKDWKGEKWAGRKPGSYKWYEIQDAVDYFPEFENPKIMLPDIALNMQALFDDKGFYCVNTAYIIPVDDKILLGILNSKLVQFYYSSISNSIRGGYLRFIRQYLEQIPIPNYSQNDALKNQVELIIALNNELKSARFPDKIEQLKSHISHTDNKINQLVYQLFKLSEVEISIIENQ
jgi:type I restriction-modification system DNA methylase subunit